jgi:hypothetical protein
VEFEHISSILERQLGSMKAIHDAQRKVSGKNIHVTVILAMVQMCLVDGDERDLAKWMSFYILKKIEKDVGKDIFNQMRKETSKMSPQEIMDLANKALTGLSNQREKIFEKLTKGEKDNG